MIVAQLKAATKRARVIASFLFLTLVISACFLIPNRLEKALARPAWLSKQIDAWSLAQQQDEDVVRVSAELVVLNATVLDKDGKFVSGLKRNDFRVFEDGAEQK